ncbi:CPBP family intramembrane glutamic endopeptidase [Paenibacillus lactis]|uniref:CPBP family intramembrane glutamic endopeptidase n=1 Tax=Paenibacillus lactis TaxID=228574 RepID=UPI00367E511B
MNVERSLNRSPRTFYVLVFALSIPFWLFGSMPVKWLPMNLPVSALMFFCPMAAALILTYREEGESGVRRLLKRIFDYKRIKQKSWYLPILFLMPMIMLLSYWFMSLIGRSLPEPNIPFLSIPILVLMYFIAAACEEMGWMGYAVEPMLNRWNALTTSMIMGTLWGIWHLVPYIQTNHSVTWIVWQCFTAILLRILMVWLYNNTGKSIFAIILFHAFVNVSITVFPDNGSHYDPVITSVFLVITIVSLLFFWDPKTLNPYRTH